MLLIFEWFFILKFYVNLRKITDLMVSVHFCLAGPAVDIRLAGPAVDICIPVQR